LKRIIHRADCIGHDKGCAGELRTLAGVRRRAGGCRWRPGLFGLFILLAAGLLQPGTGFTGSYSEILCITGSESRVYILSSGGLLAYDREQQEWLEDSLTAEAGRIQNMLMHPYTGYLWVLSDSGLFFQGAGRSWERVPLPFQVLDMAYSEDLLFIRGPEAIHEADPFSGRLFAADSGETAAPADSSLSWCDCPKNSGSASPLNIQDLEDILIRSPRDGNPLPVTVRYTESTGNEWLGTRNFGLFYRDTYYGSVSHLAHGLWQPEVREILLNGRELSVVHRLADGEALSRFPLNWQTGAWYFPKAGSEHLYCAAPEGIYISDSEVLWLLRNGGKSAETVLRLPSILSGSRQLLYRNGTLYFNTGAQIWALNSEGKILSPQFSRVLRHHPLPVDLTLGTEAVIVQSADSLSIVTAEGEAVSGLSGAVLSVCLDGQSIYAWDGQRLRTETFGVDGLDVSSDSRAGGDVDGQWRELVLPEALADAGIGILRCGGKTLFAGTRRGLWEYDISEGQWRGPLQELMPPEQEILTLEMGENILYIGTQKGLYRYHYAQ